MWPHIVSPSSILSCCHSRGELEGRQPASPDTTCPRIHASWGVFCIQRKTTPIHAFCLLPACLRMVAVDSAFAHSKHQADGASFCWRVSRGWRRVPEQPMLVELHQCTGTLRGVALISILMSLIKHGEPGTGAEGWQGVVANGTGLGSVAVRVPLNGSGGEESPAPKHGLPLGCDWGCKK